MHSRTEQLFRRIEELMAEGRGYEDAYQRAQYEWEAGLEDRADDLRDRARESR